MLWYRVIADIAGEFRFDAKYLITGWSPWVLMGLGLLCFVPVVVEDLHDRDRRLQHAGTGAWMAGGRPCACSASPSPRRWPRSPMA